MTATFILAGAYFGFLFLALVIQSQEIRHPWLFLLRSFLPNWRFYSAPGPAPRLYYRHGCDGIWSDWQPMFPRFRRSLRALVFNPDVNLALTEMNLVDHLANNINDLDDPAQIAKLVPYRMLDRLVRDKLQTYLAPWNQYQFRVCAISPGCGIDFETDTLLISPMLDRP